MNRIYQGKVTNVQIANPEKDARPDKCWLTFDPDPKQAKAKWQSALWQHHQLFQDAVNYYIVALAALGASPDSKLTRLRELLKPIWEGFDRKGQRRQGMRESLQRAWQLAEPPTLKEVVERFKKPLADDSIPANTAQKAAEYVLFKLGGDSAIQQGGREFLPMFCDVDCEATYKLSPERRGRGDDERRLQRELHRELSAEEIKALAASISLGSVVNLQPGSMADTGNAVIERVKAAAKTFADDLSENQLAEWLLCLNASFSLPKQRGGNINVRRVDACTLFLAFPNATTKAIFQSTFPSPKPKKDAQVADGAANEAAEDETRFIVDGDDPIKLARGTRGFVFLGFTALPLWHGDGRRLVWKEFDIAAFKEALKVYNQFQQNEEKRGEKLNAFAAKLLIMDGERAAEAYAGQSDNRLRERLERVWRESKGKPKAATNDSGDELSLPRFAGDARVDRLRKIVNDDLAEEYRLTDGRRTPYGLRRRTMKGWGEVKRKWQTLVKAGEKFSEVKRQALKDVLDEMRGGEKQEQIGSHKLFEALLADDAAWTIWREADEKLQEQVNKHSWATDPLEAFREYCEIREAMEEVSSRPLNFTPADARYSRRLFMFTDVCSFGKDSGEYRHDAKELAVTVPVAIRNTAGQFTVERCRLVYSAPRLLRDRIRAEDGSYVQDWTQPMMRALFGENDEAANPQELSDAAVQLMPDYDAKGQRRVLLNFPLSLEPKPCWEKVYAQRQQKELFAIRYSKRDKKKEKSLNGGIWESNLRTFWEGDNPKRRDFLYWPEDERMKPDWSEGDWWEKLGSFRVLAADLGTRHAASIAFVECGAERKGTSRFIGNAGGKEWFAHYRSGAILRLPGENAQVLRPETSLDQDGRGKAFREELYGERGRPADEAECEETLTMLEALNQSDLLQDVADAASLRKRFSLPELNDKILIAIRRAQGWIATCISWHWKLTQPDNEEQRQSTLAQIREQDRMSEWQQLADGNEQSLGKVRDALKDHIVSQRQRVQEQLLRLTVRILPLRERTWEWVAHPDKPDCHLLRQTLDGTGPQKAMLRGQRGLSMDRIEQISELRRRWQSLNQSLRREIGQKPLTASEMRNDPIPDPCPDILTRLENIREQRVNQTAHLIVAEALGLKLRVPQMSAKSREITDTHGEYEVVRPPVDMIVLEDLARYLSDQGRAKSENTRLMKWCHRAITEKVKMLAEPFGIPVMETPAAYSSRFCSLTGMAGFRAAEVGWNDRHEFRWRELLKVDLAELQTEIIKAANNKAKLETLKRQFATAKATQNTFNELEKISRSNRPHRTLLAPQPGGPMFITAREIPHPAPAVNRKQKGNAVLPMQADLNAAANLALRAVAHPA
ncbi:MAG: type V CRISPR-associated protein Cas12b, partial [Verrucomicrobiales bacterium]|nr:type V CRISPR-associated protein Cas12b [Verrucomicrobiales bacterium]